MMRDWLFLYQVNILDQLVSVIAYVIINLFIFYSFTSDIQMTATLVEVRVHFLTSVSFS